MRFDRKTCQNTASVGHGQHAWQLTGEKIYLCVEGTVLEIQVSIWPGCFIFPAGKMTSPLHLPSHLMNQDNGSRLNALCWRGWNKMVCKIKQRSEDIPWMCMGRGQSQGPTFCSGLSWAMENHGAQVALSSLLPMKVGALEDKGCCRAWISGEIAGWQPFNEILLPIPGINPEW